MDTIVLKGMHFYGYHGCFPEERLSGQPFYIDAEMQADLAAAGASDELSDTVDYGKVYQLVRTIVEGAPYNLIERLAEVIAGEILGQFPVSAVKITVHKPQAPVGGHIEDVAVVIERSRHE